MRPRLADSRIGHFNTPKVTFSDDSKFTPVRWYVQRWRLEKKEPQAALSEPVKPNVFHLGNEIPEKYREPIRQGILEWNKGFERIGFKNVLVVKQQPDDADFDLSETQYSSVRWMATSTPSFGAIGPSHVDPRTGEILDADTVEWFEENGGLDRAAGERFRRRILEIGGSRDPLVAYREFRGRDARTEPLLRRRGLA